MSVPIDGGFVSVRMAGDYEECVDGGSGVSLMNISLHRVCETCNIPLLNQRS